MRIKWFAVAVLAALLALPVFTPDLAGRAAGVQTAFAEEPLQPVVQELKEMIENDPQMYMLFQEMFAQIPDEPQYKKDPSGDPQVMNYQDMLVRMSQIVTEAPKFDTTAMVGCPLNSILNWPMGTQAGTSLFLLKKLNVQLKKVLNEWGMFLKSPASCQYLTGDEHDGWFGKDAMQAMPGFVETFVCDPAKPHWGYTSWDDFFTRRFREEARPVVSPDDDSIIANACESAPFALAKDVKLRDTFWIKSQPYSLYHMMDGDPWVDQFVGGTVYQAFLSALSYHRWHSPVSGRIVKTKLLDGSYYAAALSEGFDPASADFSQGYLTNVAARALVFIEADNPAIGLMSVMFVGMSEVSSNEITVYVGQHVNKGDQLGMFHFGGSTHCLIFRPGVNLEFDLRGQTPSVEATNIPVRSKIATVLK